jgi:hypothetical protein
VTPATIPRSIPFLEEFLQMIQVGYTVDCRRLEVEGDIVKIVAFRIRKILVCV